MTWRRMGVSWKTYVDQLRTDDRQAVTVALAVADRALTEAKAATNEQFKALGDKLDRLESRAGGPGGRRCLGDGPDPAADCRRHLRVLAEVRGR